MSKPESPATQECQALYLAGVWYKYFYVVDFQRWSALSKQGTCISKLGKDTSSRLKNGSDSKCTNKLGITPPDRRPPLLQCGQRCLQKEEAFLSNSPKTTFLLSSAYDFAVTAAELGLSSVSLLRSHTKPTGLTHQHLNLLLTLYCFPFKKHDSPGLLSSLWAAFCAGRQVE